MKIKQTGRYLFSYNKWRELIGDKEYLKLNHNTFCWSNKQCATIEFYLHGNNILILSDNNRFLYDNCGFETLTTKRRLNQLGPIHIFQQNYIWYYLDIDMVQQEYKNGMIVDVNLQEYEYLW